MVFDLHRLIGVIFKFEDLCADTVNQVLDHQIFALECLLFIRRLFFHRVRACRYIPKLPLRIIPAECQRRIRLGRGEAHKVTCLIKFTILTKAVLNRKVKNRTFGSRRTVHLLFDRDSAFFR